MRLYRLLRRVGRRKRRPYPWFAPPAPEAPKRYYGWVWDPAKEEWLPTDIPKLEIGIEVPKYPEPTEPPVKAKPDHVPGWDWSFGTQSWEEVPLTRKEVTERISPGSMPTYVPTAGTPTDVEGWSWSERHEAWVATIVMGERVGFQPPLSMPPFQVSPEMEAGSEYMTDWFRMQMLLVRMGRSKAEIDALMDQIEFQLRGLSFEARKAYRHGIFEMVVQNWNRSRGMGSQGGLDLWRGEMERFVSKHTPQVSPTVAVGVAVVMATLIGIFMGLVLDSLVTPAEEAFIMPEEEATYLMGPEEWFYSRNIGVSPQGNLYYSKCEGIGTEYVRHKRGVWGSLYDTIDFPGGFVEEGYQFPYWVKYTWSHWDIVYIGMMFSSSEMVYALKKEFISLEERARRVTVRPSTEWCSGFHWYL